VKTGITLRRKVTAYPVGVGLQPYLPNVSPGLHLD